MYRLTSAFGSTLAFATALIFPSSADSPRSVGSGKPAKFTPTYSILDLGPVGQRANTYVINAKCLNDSGSVVGWANDGGPYDFMNDTAFLWSPHTGMHILQGVENATASLALAVNNREQAVGMSGNPFPVSNPVIWNAGTVEALPLPDGIIGGMAFGINNHGTVVGGVMSESGAVRAIVWQDGIPTLLSHGVGNNATDSWCYTVNDHGMIVGEIGTDAVVWIGGEPVLIEGFGGASGHANSINNRGQVVGFALTAEGDLHAFLWEDGERVDLSEGEDYSSAIAINNRGQIVGAAGTGNLLGNAVLWENGRRISLGSTIPAGSDWVLIEADSINDRGQIAGIGLHNGQSRVFLLTPNRR